MMTDNILVISDELNHEPEWEVELAKRIFPSYIFLKECLADKQYTLLSMREDNKPPYNVERLMKIVKKSKPSTIIFDCSFLDVVQKIISKLLMKIKMEKNYFPRIMILYSEERSFEETAICTERLRNLGADWIGNIFDVSVKDFRKELDDLTNNYGKCLICRDKFLYRNKNIQIRKCPNCENWFNVSVDNMQLIVDDEMVNAIEQLQEDDWEKERALLEVKYREVIERECNKLRVYFICTQEGGTTPGFDTGFKMLDFVADSLTDFYDNLEYWWIALGEVCRDILHSFRREINTIEKAYGLIETEKRIWGKKRVRGKAQIIILGMYELCIEEDIRKFLLWIKEEKNYFPKIVVLHMGFGEQHEWVIEELRELGVDLFENIIFSSISEFKDKLEHLLNDYGKCVCCGNKIVYEEDEKMRIEKCGECGIWIRIKGKEIKLVENEKFLGLLTDL